MLIRTYQRRRGGRSSQSDDGSQESFWSSQESAPLAFYSSQESGWSQTEELDLGKPGRSGLDGRDIPTGNSQSDGEDEGGSDRERADSLGLDASARAILMPPPANRQSKSKEMDAIVTGVQQKKSVFYKSHSAPSSPSQLKKRKQVNGSSPRKALKVHSAVNGESSKSGKVVLLARSRSGFRSGSRWGGISVPAAPPSSTLMEAQESGEMIEHVDEANFALDGLRVGQPLRVLRASMATMAQLCGSAERRRLLRNHGMARPLLEAVVALPVEDAPLALAAAAVLFFLASDGHDEELLDSEKCIKFVLNLLRHPLVPAGKAGHAPAPAHRPVGLGGSASERAAAAVEARVRGLFAAGSEVGGGERGGGQDGGHHSAREGRAQNSGACVGEGGVDAQEISPRWLALLTLEQACSSAVLLDDTNNGGGTGSKAGRFKERLREQGGLDAVCQLASLCVRDMQACLEGEGPRSGETSEEGKREASGPGMLLRCLRVMENVTFLSGENQRHLIEMHLKDGTNSKLPQPFLMLLLDSIKTLSALEAICSKQLIRASQRRQGPNAGHGSQLDRRLQGPPSGHGPSVSGQGGSNGGKAVQLFEGPALQRAFEKSCAGRKKAGECLGEGRRSQLESEDSQLEEEMGEKYQSGSFRLFAKHSKPTSGKQVNGERSAGGVSLLGTTVSKGRSRGTESVMGADILERGSCRVGMEMEFEPRKEVNESQEADSGSSQPPSQPQLGRPPVQYSKDSLKRTAKLSGQLGRTGKTNEQQLHVGTNEIGKSVSSDEATCQPGKDTGKHGRCSKRAGSTLQVAGSGAGGKAARADSAPVLSVFDFDEPGLAIGEETGVRSAEPPVLGMDLSEEVARRLSGEGWGWDAEQPRPVAEDPFQFDVEDERHLDAGLARREDGGRDQEERHGGEEKKGRDKAKAKGAQIGDCLVSAVKVLMNVTNENPAGCRLVAASGGLHTISALAMSRCCHLSVVAASRSDLASKPCTSAIMAVKERGAAGNQTGDGGKKADKDEMSAEDVDLLMVALGVLVNLVEKDEGIRAQLAQQECSLAPPPGENTEAVDKVRRVGMIPFLCALFLSKQGAGEAAIAAEEKAQMEAMDAEEQLEAGQKEAEAMMVEAYAALLLAFLSRESESARESMAQRLPGGHLGALVPVLEHFIAFHQTLNTITPESHAAVQTLIGACRPSTH